MIDLPLTFLANLLPIDLRSDPVLVAYRQAYKGRSDDAGDGALIDAMKRVGVSGIYTEPYGNRVQLALQAWRRRDKPRELRQALRRL